MNENEVVEVVEEVSSNNKFAKVAIVGTVVAVGIAVALYVRRKRKNANPRFDSERNTFFKELSFWGVFFVCL